MKKNSIFNSPKSGGGSGNYKLQKPRYTLEGKVFYGNRVPKTVVVRGVSHNTEHVTIGMNIDKIPLSIKQAFKAGSKERGLIANAITKNDNGELAIFLSGLTMYVKGDLDIAQGDEVIADININIVTGNGDPKVFFNLKSISVASDEAVEEEPKAEAEENNIALTVDEDVFA